MDKIKTYKCQCGEDVYEDDGECVNCGIPVEQTMLKEVNIPKITEQGPITEIEDNLLG